MAVKAIPEGYHSLTPYVNVTGAEKAIEFYKKAFGAEEKSRMPGPDGRIVHCELQIGSSLLMVAEAVMDPPTQGGVHFYANDVDAVYQRALAAGATTIMPPQDMFWGDRFARIADPFGQKWGIATHKEDVSPEEMGKRAAAFAASMKK